RRRSTRSSTTTRDGCARRCRASPSSTPTSYCPVTGPRCRCRSRRRWPRRWRGEGHGVKQIDEYVVRTLPGLQPGPPVEADADLLRALFAAQVQSRHLDLAARELQSRGHGHYTIGSAGHESDAALGLLSRVTDPALLHYRSGGLYAARAARAGRTDAIRAVLLGLVSSRREPTSGGRRKAVGHPALGII